MIEEISFKNVLSFRDETLLSFEATADTSIENAHVVRMPNGQRLLRMAIVFGANASGKSNLLLALEALYRFWLHNPSNMDHQSAGTRRLLGMEAAVYELTNRGSFLMIDEMDASLHPDLMEYILKKFLLEQNDSQMLITTHYDGLLSKIDDLIRKDNVWFTEKEASGTTRLYSLVEFKGLNKIPRIDRAYRNGLFGALPQIKD